MIDMLVSIESYLCLLCFLCFFHKKATKSLKFGEFCSEIMEFKGNRLGGKKKI
jgi:hypothetical protein